MPLVFFTIIARNYLAQARTLAQSIRQFHPESEFHVALADEPCPTTSDPKSSCDDRIQWIPLECLNLPDLTGISFRYDTLELSTAIKPRVFQKLLQSRDRVVYLDPDILLLNRLRPVEEALDHFSILLTPHVLEPPVDRSGPTELDFLRAGTFNLGFLALKNTQETERLLHWWGERLEENCRMDVERGFHVDQRWMDLIPSYFTDFGILREPGLNIAYWNLRQRRLDRNEFGYRIGNAPAYFFHFSGYNPETPERYSRHFYPQFILETQSLEELHRMYAAKLMENGYEEFSKLVPQYNRFESGRTISMNTRRLYREMPPNERLLLGNPFSKNAETLLLRKTTSSRPLSRLGRRARSLWRSRFQAWAN